MRQTVSEPQVPSRAVGSFVVASVILRDPGGTDDQLERHGISKELVTPASLARKIQAAPAYCIAGE